MRDFYYAPNMHGLDWKVCRTINMLCSLPDLNHRADLDYIIGVG